MSPTPTVHDRPETAPAPSERAPGWMVVGRYVLAQPIAAGGMATVYFGRQIGAAGFSRTVAIKRMHPRLATDASFADMFVDESRIAARVRHPSVISILDVVALRDELLVVMEYVHGEPLWVLAGHRSGVAAPPRIALRVIHDVLQGLHAAHEARDARGEPLGIVHRDVTPENVIVGTDGLSRLADFGIAKAARRVHMTRDAEIKGKLSYMAPEQLEGSTVTRRADIYAASVVLWEMLTGRTLFLGREDGSTLRNVLYQEVARPSTLEPAVPKAVDDLVLRGLSRDPDQRFPTALAMAEAIERASPLASTTEVARWLEVAATDGLELRAEAVQRLDQIDDELLRLAQSAADAEQADVESLRRSSRPRATSSAGSGSPGPRSPNDTPTDVAAPSFTPVGARTPNVTPTYVMGTPPAFEAHATPGSHRPQSDPPAPHLRPTPPARGLDALSRTLPLEPRAAISVAPPLAPPFVDSSVRMTHVLPDPRSVVPPPPQGRRSRAWVLGSLLGFVVVAATAALSVWANAERAPLQMSVVAAPVTAGDVPREIPEPPAASAEPLPIVPGAVGSTSGRPPTDRVRVEPVGTRGPIPTQHRGHRSDPARPPASTVHPAVSTTTSSSASPVTAASCDPPYTVDANGHHVFRRECFGAAKRP